MMDQDAAEQFAREWIEAWNSHSVEQILIHYAEEVEFHSPLVSRLLNGAAGPVQGKAALREYFRAGLTAYPDLTFQLLRVLGGTESVVLYYRSIRNLYAAEVMEFNAQGRVRRVLAHYAPEAADQNQPGEG